MEWKFLPDGGFAVCSDAGNWCYAYPTSPHAVDAKNRPWTVARKMAASADTFAHLPGVAEYNARIAAL